MCLTELGRVVCPAQHLTTPTVASHPRLSLILVFRQFSWGLNNKHQLGHGDKQNYVSPTLVESLQSMVIQKIRCGGNSSAVLTGRPVNTDALENVRNMSMRLRQNQRTLKIFVGIVTALHDQCCCLLHCYNLWCKRYIQFEWPKAVLVNEIPLHLVQH
jgi:hypothetical protein